LPWRKSKEWPPQTPAESSISAAFWCSFSPFESSLLALLGRPEAKRDNLSILNANQLGERFVLACNSLFRILFESMKFAFDVVRALQLNLPEASFKATSSSKSTEVPQSHSV